MNELYREGIGGIESAGSGGYKAVGATDADLGRALGKYQIMEANIPVWSKEVLGRAVSADEFMASEEIQDAIFDGKFGEYVARYGPEGAAQAWFGGPGGVGQTGRTDVHGRLNIGQYGQEFMNNIGAGDYDLTAATNALRPPETKEEKQEPPKYSDYVQDATQEPYQTAVNALNPQPMGFTKETNPFLRILG